MLAIKEILCKSVLSRSGISAVDYAVNPYRGCEHGCVYCYARFIQRFTGHKERWGKFVDVRINAPQVLAHDLSKATKGVVLLSSVTDPYQPLEKKYELTRKCLQRLLAYHFPITILTKSALVLRDIDLLAKFPECEVGFTITTINEEARKKYELRSSPVEERLTALEELHERGISTYAFLGPMLPYITDASDGLRNMIQSFANVNVDYILVDRLNMRWDVWASVVEFLKQHYPDLIPAYKQILLSRNKQILLSRNSNYFEELKPKILRLCMEYGVKCEFCY